ncbi:glycoside hydrolase [Micromonospora sp. CPCC 206061]|uniref:glycoside hydrolase n=1 Tax=Micromonospora sp. CPCC 206061 TaxID=3122410 RepID=UPI002FF0763E
MDIRNAVAMLSLAVGMAVAPAGPAVAQAGAEAVEAAPVVIRIDPSYQQPSFEGWGTSLVWFANVTGGYPDEIRTKLVDMLFGEDGLRLNIARYNIGGGNAPEVRKDYMKTGATMEGFWRAPEGTTREDMDWWDPNNPDHWNWDADANQRWWIDQIKDKVDRWESFSNSPPWFQTVSGYVSGGFNASSDQIRTDTVDEFATYLVRVTEELERRHGIQFDTIAPLNEPNTPYWGTQLGPDGQPTGGRQEGAHAGPALQQLVVQATARALEGAQTGAVVSAMDETNPGTFTTNWNAYTAQTKAVVDQMNVHTYGTGQRTSVRDLAKGEDQKLWMSEVEGSFLSGTSYTSMEPGLGIATRMVDDLRELEPSAWVFWQPVEDTIPQAAGGGNWGSIHIPFNCAADATLETCPIQPNTKFHTIRNFTHYIRPGDRVVKVDNASTIAAIKPSGSAATVVHVNNDAASRSVTLDLSLFRHVGPHATVTPVITSADGALVRGAPVRVAGGAATLTVPGKSVTTFLVKGVRGVAKGAALVQEGHVYRLRGVQSGRSLTPTADGTGLVIRTDDPASTAQLWKVRNLTEGVTNRERYELVNVATGTPLTAGVGTQWMLSTTGDGTYTLVNAETGRLIDVGGQATADGSPVSTYTPTSGSNQRWTVVDETAQRVAPVSAYTVPGLRPTLPDTVTPVYRDGARGSLPVVWTYPPDGRWRQPGTVKVKGVATDVLGRELRAEATVAVDTFGTTVPGRAKAYAGGLPDLPVTVTGVGDHGARVELPVTWTGGASFDQVGVVTVTGTARVVDGSTLPATARVQVAAPAQRNAAPDGGVTVGATYTESGYSAAGLRNGNRTEKAWSNWRSGAKNPSDTITYTFPTARDVTRVATWFYRDGSNLSFPSSLKVQVLDPAGAWVDASADVPVGTEGTVVADVPIQPVSTTGVRVVMAMRPDGYATVSEVEVYAKAPGVSSDAAAAAIEVDGVPVAGFAPDVTEYRVVTPQPRKAVVTATPRDPYATVAVEKGPDRRLVTVTSEDGTATRTYTVELVRR